MSISFLDFLIIAKFNYNKAKYYKKYYYKILDNDLFDEDFYLTNYSDVNFSEIDPLLHYLSRGFMEDKLPNTFLDWDEYLNKHPEIKKNNLNPLVYYIENGLYDENYKNKILNTNYLFLTDKKLDYEPLISIIILNKDGLNHLKCLFKDFDKKTNYSNYEIIVVDNASKDGSVNYLNSLDLPIKIIKNKENVSFSKGNNDAVKLASGEYILLLNNDIEPTFGWLNEMVQVILSDSEIGAVGAKLLFPFYEDISNQFRSFSIQHAGVKFKEVISPYIYAPYHEHLFLTDVFSKEVNYQKEVFCNTGACLLISKELYLLVDGLDENYFYGYEDIDFALKIMKKGFKSVYCPQALLFHHESATRKMNSEEGDINLKNICYFRNKWKNLFDKLILIDKIYNYNFITNKKLSFIIVNNDSSNELFINELIKYLNDKGYNINLINEVENGIIGVDCDILISFCSNLNINNFYARINLIKILINDKDNEDYDITINNKNLTILEFINKLMKNIEDFYV